MNTVKVRKPVSTSWRTRPHLNIDEDHEKWAAINIDALVFTRDRWSTSLTGLSNAMLVCCTSDGVQVASERMAISLRRGGWVACATGEHVPTEYKGRDDSEQVVDKAIERARAIEQKTAIAIVRARVAARVAKAQHYVSPAGELERRREECIRLRAAIKRAQQTIDAARARIDVLFEEEVGVRENS